MVERNNERCNAQPTSIVQNKTTYYGHWHGDYAVYDDGALFLAGHGWVPYTQGQSIIARLCN